MRGVAEEDGDLGIAGPVSGEFFPSLYLLWSGEALHSVQGSESISLLAVCSGILGDPASLEVSELLPLPLHRSLDLWWGN